jgi:hypothetical protein
LQPDLYQAPSLPTGDREPAPPCPHGEAGFHFLGQVAERGDTREGRHWLLTRYEGILELLKPKVAN